MKMKKQRGTEEFGFFRNASFVVAVGELNR